MFSKILCPVDGSDHAQKALELAADLAKAGGGRLIILHTLLNSGDGEALRRFAEVEHLGPTVVPELNRMRAAEGRLDYDFAETTVSSQVLEEVGGHVLQAAVKTAETKGVSEIETRMLNGDPATQALRVVDSEAIDCVVVGSRGLSDMKALFLGSVSHKIANQAPCTVITVK